MRFNEALSRYEIQHNLEEIVAITHAVIYSRDWATLDKMKAVDCASYLLAITCDDEEAKRAIIDISKEKDDYVRLLSDLLDKIYPFSPMYSLSPKLRG